MRVVSNSGPLIHLTRAGHFNLLQFWGQALVFCYRAEGSPAAPLLHWS